MKKIFLYISDLITEGNPRKLSLGRVSWWIVLGPCLYIWTMSGGDIADHHATLLLILAGYNLGKKGIEAFGKKTEENDGPG